MTSLTIIIPFLKETDTDLFEGTLVSVLENRPADADILVINAAEYDNCYDLSAEEGVVFLSADPKTTLIEAVNLGVQQSETPFIHPILCGCQVEEGWTDAAVSRFSDDTVAAVIPAVCDEGKTHPSCGLAFRPDGVLIPLNSSMPIPSHSLLTPSIKGAFFRRTPLLDLGLFHPQFGPFAYTDMALLLYALNFKTIFEKDSSLLCAQSVLPAPTREEWITVQEQIYRRWSGFWGTGAKRAHQFRVLKEKLAAFFNGTSSQISGAYKKGRLDTGIPSRKKLISAAKSAALARIKNR